MSLENSLLFPNSFFNSFETTLIVANGVPKECAAAAAWPPKDSNSYSFATTSCNFLTASDRLLLSPAPSVVCVFPYFLIVF